MHMPTKISYTSSVFSLYTGDIIKSLDFFFLRKKEKKKACLKFLPKSYPEAPVLLITSLYPIHNPYPSTNSHLLAFRLLLLLSSTNAFSPLHRTSLLLRLSLLPALGALIRGGVFTTTTTSLSNQALQPLILRLELLDAAFELLDFIRHFLCTLLELRFALLLLDAEACRGGCVAAALVFFGCDARVLFEVGG